MVGYEQLLDLDIVGTCFNLTGGFSVLKGLSTPLHENVSGFHTYKSEDLDYTFVLIQVLL